MSDLPAEFVRAVSEQTGVPAEFLTGDTAEHVWDSAERIARWKAETAPPPQTSAVVASSPPPTRITAQQMTEGNDWLTAWRTGRLAGAGAPAPPPRRTGERHRNAAP